MQYTIFSIFYTPFVADERDAKIPKNQIALMMLYIAGIVVNDFIYVTIQ